jgi:histone H3
MLNTYIKKLFKASREKGTITTQALGQISSILEILAVDVARIAKSRMVVEERRTIVSKHVIFAARDIFGKGPIVPYIERKLDGYERTTKRSKGKRLEVKAGLTLSVSRCKTYLRDACAKMATKAAIALAALLEYVVVAIFAAVDDHTPRVTSRHITIALHNDDTLHLLRDRYSLEIEGGGVIPHIERDLVSKSTKKRPQAQYTGGITNPHRFRPGTVALREIRRYQKSTDLLIRRAPFERRVREILKKLGGDKIRLGDGSSSSIQSYVESLVTRVFRLAPKLAIHASRSSISKLDMELAIVFIIDEQTLIPKMVSPEVSKIPRAPLRKLARRGGVKRMTRQSIDVALTLIDRIVFGVLIKALNDIESNKKMTITTNVVDRAIKSCGSNFIL